MIEGTQEETEYSGQQAPEATGDQANFPQDLWDGFDAVCARWRLAKKGTADLVQCCKDRGTMSDKFSSTLRGIRVATFQEEGTIGEAWRQFKEQAEKEYTIQKTLGQAITQISTDLNAELSKASQECTQNETQGKQITRKLAKARADAEKAKSKYAKAFRDWDLADYNFHLANTGNTAQQKELQKLKKAQFDKQQQRDQTREDYSKSVEECRRVRQEYDTQMAEILAQFQAADNQRLESMKHSMLMLADCTQEAAQSLIAFAGAVRDAASSVNPAADQVAFVAAAKTGESPPPFVEFAEMTREHNVPDVSVAPTPPSSSTTTTTTTTADTGKKKLVLAQYDAQEDNELTLPEGALVTVLQENVAGEGWALIRSAEGRDGLFPMTFLEDPPAPSPPSPSPAVPSPPPPVPAAPVADGKKRCRALFNFEADSESELALKEGDIIVLDDPEPADGWYLGTNSQGQQGYFPEDYVEMLV